MDQLLCPLCGRRVSLKIFSPDLLDDDIYAVTLASLGRARGFKEVDRYSVLAMPDITAPIALRCSDILKMIQGENRGIEQNIPNIVNDAGLVYSNTLGTQEAPLIREPSLGADCGVDPAEMWRRRALEAEAVATGLRGRIDDLERRVRFSTNSNLSLEECVDFLMER